MDAFSACSFLDDEGGQKVQRGEAHGVEFDVDLALAATDRVHTRDAGYLFKRRFDLIFDDVPHLV
jgi:hypothetical protein